MNRVYKDSRRRLPRPVLSLAALALTLSAGAIVHAEPLSGAVLDGVTLAPIEGATVTIAATGHSVQTNAAGRFAIADAPAGAVVVRIEAEGYEPSEQSVTRNASQDAQAEPDSPAGPDAAPDSPDAAPDSPDADPAADAGVILLLFRPGAAAEVIEIIEEGPARPESPGKQALARVEITRLPGTRGDALTSIKSLPGVANADAAGAGPGLLVIRGAAPEDSRVTLDGIEIPLLYHFFGLQSIIPSEFIENIEFLPGGFGADEGNATGGMIRIATRDKEIAEYAGFAELSFINFAGFVEGPISERRKLSFAAGVRRSAIDLILPQVIPEDANIAFTTAPYYYDGQARVDWRPDSRNRVSVLALASFDLLSLLNDNINPNEPLLTGKFENETSFTRLITTWRHATPGLENRLVAAVGTTLFRVEIGDAADNRLLAFDSRRFDVRDDVAVSLGRRARVRAGGELVLESTNARVRFPLPPAEGSGGQDNFSSLPVIERDETVATNGAGAYVAADVSPTRSTTVTPGLRLDYFDRIGQTALSPRLQVVQKLPDAWKLSLSIGSYSRAPGQAEAAQLDLVPERATQYVAGAEHELAPGISLSLAGFYTDRRKLVVQDPVRAMTDPGNAYVNRGLGRSFGVEALARVRKDAFFGWVAYTLSRSDRMDAPGDELRLFDFDQTHNLIAVASWQWGGWTFGGRWQYNTGTPITPVIGSIFLSDRNIYVPVYGPINSDRLTTAHQLDVRIDRKWTFESFELSAYLDVTNVYANPKTLGFQYNFDFSQRQAIEELPIVPAIGIRGSF